VKNGDIEAAPLGLTDWDGLFGELLYFFFAFRIEKASEIRVKVFNNFLIVLNGLIMVTSVLVSFRQIIIGC